jgi:homogentisate 1,2-dioxygenase
MLNRLVHGVVPAKPHTALYAPPAAGTHPSSRVHYETCWTRGGFEGPFTIVYHERPPQAWRADGALLPCTPERASASFARRHFQTDRLPASLGASAERQPLLWHPTLSVSVLTLTASDQAYRLDADRDELLFALNGSGFVRSALGDLDFGAGDYVLLPKGLLHRIELRAKEARLLSLSFSEGVGIPRRFRNDAGQLRMDAPYSHRDFRSPNFQGPIDEGLREVWVFGRGGRQRFVCSASPLDVVGWDGSVYPIALPILAFQPRVGSVHLPPTVHGTFDSAGALVCSFVPRPLDFHPGAIPCPYAHTSVDMDEILFYVSGNFGSRRGIGVGSLTYHPAGVPHGPHPGKYEESIGRIHTDEVAVMLDCKVKLEPTQAACAVEDTAYEASFAAS